MLLPINGCNSLGFRWNLPAGEVRSGYSVAQVQLIGKAHGVGGVGLKHIHSLAVLTQWSGPKVAQPQF